MQVTSVSGAMIADTGCVAAGLTGVLAATAALRHACTPAVAKLGPLNPYVAAAFEEWGIGSSGKGCVTAVVSRQAAPAPPSAASHVAGECDNLE